MTPKLARIAAFVLSFVHEYPLLFIHGDILIPTLARGLCRDKRLL